jgi:hypothetical protein
MYSHFQTQFENQRLKLDIIQRNDLSQFWSIEFNVIPRACPQLVFDTSAANRPFTYSSITAYCIECISISLFEVDINLAIVTKRPTCWTFW